MLIINLQNVEELIFFDSKLRSLLPNLRHTFDQWMLGRRIPSLRPLGLQALMDFINGLTAKDIEILEEYFEDSIMLNKIDYHIVKNITLSLDENLTTQNNLSNFVASRDGEHLYITFWG